MLPRPLISGLAPTRPSASRSLLTRGSHDHDCVPALRFASKPTLSSPTSCHFSLFRELEPCYNEQAVTIKEKLILQLEPRSVRRVTSVSSVGFGVVVKGAVTATLFADRSANLAFREIAPRMLHETRPPADELRGS